MKHTRKEYEQQRQELLDLLYTMVDELEHNPSLRRRRPGFPFDMLESSIYQMLKRLKELSIAGQCRVSRDGWNG